MNLSNEVKNLANSPIPLKDVIGSDNKLSKKSLLNNFNINNVGGIYAFWLIKEFTNTADLQKKINLWGAGHRKIEVTWEDFKQSNFQCLYIGKTTKLANRISMHLSLGTKEWYNDLPDNRVFTDGHVLKRNSQCQFRAGFEHLLKYFDEDINRIDLIKNHVGITFIPFDGDNHVSTRFYLEDYAIGYYQPWFNLDSER